MRGESSIDAPAGAPTPSAWGSYKGTGGREIASTKGWEGTTEQPSLGFLPSYLET